MNSIIGAVTNDVVFGELPVLVTPRLILRQVRPDDAVKIYPFFADPKVAEWTGWEPHQNIAQTVTYLNHLAESHKNKQITGASYAVQQGKHLLGLVGIGRWTPGEQVEICYCLHSKFWGRGYATESARALLDLAFNKLRVNRVYARIFPSNERSQRVAKKLNMTYEGTIRQDIFTKGQFYDAMIWSILRQEYVSDGQKS